jgi:MATE family multidrug resistance protein
MATIETSAPETVRQEVGRTLKLATPIAVALLGEMGMVVIDYMMAGRLGGEAVAAAGLGGQVLFIPILWAMGALAAVGAVGAQAHGAGDSEQVTLAIRQGFRMATILAIPCVVFYVVAWPVLPLFEDDAQIVDIVRTMLLWSLPIIPLTLWFTVLRNFVTIMSRPNIVTVAAFVGLGVTFIGNYAFMYGNWGMPRLGVPAIGLTASLATFAQLLTITVYVVRHPELRAYRLFQELRNYHAVMFADLTRVGLPIAFAYIFESGLFFMTTLLMGTFETDALAGHNVVMNISSIIFMIPYALSQAATVRVGICIGEGRPRAARNAGSIAVGLAIMWMLGSASLMWTQPHVLAGLYLDRELAENQSAIAYAVVMMAIAAVFQIADGVQVAASGALRGLKDTKVPMVISALGYWVFGLAGGIILAFPLGFGPIGLWMGLAIGLTVSASLLAWRWFTLSRRIVMPRPA